MDVMSKIFICVINVHWLEILYAHWTKYQFGVTPYIGCRNGIFTIKTLLNMRNYHNLQTYVTVVGKFKYFDTGGHEILIKVLEIHGAPQMFYSDIHRIYQELIVVLNIWNIIEAIIQEVGVIEGDSMAPLSFLFLMATFSVILNDIWEDNDFKKCMMMILRR